MATSCHKMKKIARKQEGRWRRCHGSKSVFYLEKPENCFFFLFFFLVRAKDTKDVRMGGVRVWELTGDDEKEETGWTEGRRMQGVVGGLQMEYIW